MISDRLRRVREVMDWTQVELAEKTGVQQSLIALIESGARNPSDELLARISSETGYPVTFFTDDLEADFPMGSLLYRKYASLTSSERNRAYRLAQQNYEIVKRACQRLTPLPLQIPKNIDEDPMTAARLMRSTLGYDPGKPITNLINRLEKSGVYVISLPEEIEKLDAFSAWVEGRAIIILSPKKPGDRQRMSVSHELGHLVLHQSFSGSLDEIEKEANCFAAEFLVPEYSFRSDVRLPLTLSQLVQMKPKWGVSIQMLIHRAADLGLITQRQSRYLWMQVGKKGWRKQEPIELAIPAEKPRALRRMIEILYGDPIAYKRLADDTRLPVFLVRKIVESHASKQELGRGTIAKSNEVREFRRKE